MLDKTKTIKFSEQKKKWGRCNEKLFSKHLEAPSACNNGFTGIPDIVLYHVCSDGRSGYGVQEF